MFQKKDYIYSESMGVCRVDDVTNLSPKKGNAVSYYVLRSVYQKDKVAYIPAEKHSVVLRNLISGEEAEKLQAAYNPEQLSEEDIKMQYKISDTLSEEERQQLYCLGEIVFVLKKQE